MNIIDLIEKLKNDSNNGMYYVLEMYYKELLSLVKQRNEITENKPNDTHDFLNISNEIDMKYCKFRFN